MVSLRRHESNWRAHLAHGGLGLAGFLAIIGCCYAQGGHSSQHIYDTTNPYGMLPRSQYQPNCQAPKTRDDAEYCVEWRSTVAVEEQAEWSFDQFAASMVGIAGVLGTLIYTAKAVGASQRSAAASEAAVKTMLDIDKRQAEDVKASIAVAQTSANAALLQAQAMVAAERAYVLLDNVLEYNGFAYILNGTNVGRTYAHCQECIVVTGATLPSYPNWINPEIPVCALDVGIPRDIKGPLIKFPIYQVDQFLWGRLTYADVFKKVYWEWFRYDRKGTAWVYAQGETEWNRAEEVENKP